MKRIHGGDWKSFEEMYGRLPLDFSASVSPLGMPEPARQAAAAALSECGRYPDPACRNLREAIAAHYGLQTEEILCGNGASDLLERLIAAVKPRRALIPAPAYGEYRQVLERSGCLVREYRLREEADFRAGEDLLSALTPDLDLVILCEPGNPTGRTTDRALLKKIVCRCDQLGILLAVDECFNDFLDDPAAHSLLGELRHHRLLVLRAFTKFYGMAGLRLGWCACEDAEFLQRMREAGQPWPVSAPAMAAGIAALQAFSYEAELKELIREERSKVSAGLSACGFRAIPGEANFLLFQASDPMLGEKMAAQGILLRDCRDFSGLAPGWYRTAIRLPEENDRLLTAIKAVVLCDKIS